MRPKMLPRCLQNDMRSLGLRQTLKCSRIISLVLLPTLASGYKTVNRIRDVGIKAPVAMTHSPIQNNGDSTWKHDGTNKGSNHDQALDAAGTKNHRAGDYHTGKNEEGRRANCQSHREKECAKAVRE